MNIAEFAMQFPKHKYRAGETIFTSGSGLGSLYYLAEGFVKRSVHSLDGRELIVHIFKKDSVFPLFWALFNEEQNINLTALSDAKVHLIPKDAFLNFIEQNPKELSELLRHMTLGIEGLAKRVEILSFDKADKKLAQALIYLSKHFGNNFKFTHEELASLTGLSRERVSIEMKLIKESGAINYSRGNISIRDHAYLTEV